MRELIFDQALHLFSSRGYGGASMRALARHCGTTPSNVYNYFPSKRDLLEEVFRRGARQIGETIAAGQRDGPPDLTAYLASVVATVRAHRGLWRLIHQLRHDETVRDSMEREFGEVLRTIGEDLGRYTDAPWFLLALVDGIAGSIVQGLPLPDDAEIVSALDRAVQAVDSRSRAG